MYGNMNVSAGKTQCVIVEGGNSEHFKRSINGGTASVHLTCFLKCQKACAPLCMRYSKHMPVYCVRNVMAQGDAREGK